MQDEIFRTMNCWLRLSDDEKKEFSKIFKADLPNHKEMAEITALIKEKLRGRVLEAMDSGPKKKTCPWCGQNVPSF